MNNEKKRVLSCIQPTGEMHLGNYFGAVKNWVDIQDQYDCYYGIVDLHAMTMPYKANVLRENTENMAIDLIACGVDLTKAKLFIQSLVPEHTELAWTLGCVASYGELTRMTQFKEKSGQMEEGNGNQLVSAGLFTYPVLQAADILMYRAQLVPVGRDQEQHLELSRNIAVRFNKQFGKVFHEPQPLFTSIPKLMSLADPTKKMSKSLGPAHYIGLFEEEESIRKKVRSAVTATASGGEMSVGVQNLFSLLMACGATETHNTLLEREKTGVLQYSVLKDAVGDVLVDLTSNFIQRRKETMDEKEKMMREVHLISAAARYEARKTMEEVRRAVGVPTNVFYYDTASQTV